MPKKTKLLRDEISRTLQKGRRFHGQFCSVSFVQGDSGKAAVVVSKAVARLASERARIKRRYREILRKTKIPGKAVLTAKKMSTNASFKELNTDIEKVFTQIQNSI